MRTGYLLVDGSESLKRAPAVPRHWLAALCIVIVAQWGWWQVTSISQLIVLWVANGGGFGLLGDSTIYARFELLSLLLGGALVSVIALSYAWRMDGRSASALGLNGATLPCALVWTVAGVVAASPIVFATAMLQPQLGGLMQGVAILTPVTIVQAGAEEIVFRGIILTMLSARYGVPVGIGVSALLFGLWHADLGQSPLSNAINIGSTLVFGVTAAILTLHYANIGPALALHVVWNVVSGAYGAAGAEDFWSGWVSTAYRGWTWMAIENGDLFKLLIVPLLIESLIIFAACRETVHRLFGVRAAEAA